MDFSEIVSAVDFTGLALVIIGLYALFVSVAVVTWGVERVMALVGGGDGGGKGGDDYWDGYSLVDDSRDRGLAAVYERAAAMAAAGEGQSEDFRHNTVTAAYDAGYSGRYLDGSADPAAIQAWNDGRDAMREDRIRVG